MAQIFAARVPIYNKDYETLAYEIVGSDEGTCSALINRGVESLTSGSRSPILIKHHNILDDSLLIPKDYPVWLHCFTPADIDYARERGWRLVINQESEFSVYSISEINMLLIVTPKLLRQCPPKKNRHLLVTNVNTYKDYQDAIQINADCMQGPFILPAEILKGDDQKSSSRISYELISRLSDQNTDLDEIEQLLMADNLLASRVMRLASSVLAAGRQLESLKDAIVLMGYDNIRSIVMLARKMDVAKAERPHVLIIKTLVHAKMCELVADQLRLSKAKARTIGLLSTLPLMTGMKKEQIFEDLPLESEVIDALLYKKGVLGRLLLDVENYEDALFEKIHTLDSRSDVYVKAYTESLHFADQTYRQLFM